MSCATAHAHAQVWAELAKAGVLIGPHDLWLAAACLAYGLTMITASIREFARVRIVDLTNLLNTSRIVSASSKQNRVL